MKTIYIDCTSSIPTKSYPFHGGRYYIFLLLLELQKRNFSEHEFILLLPADFTPGNVFEESIYNSGYYKFIRINSLSDDLKLNDESALFLPLLYKLEDFKAVKQLKRNNPTVKIIATIHDLRHQFNRYGSLSRYYYTGLIYLLYIFYTPVRWLHNTFIYDPAIRRTLKVIEKIFTISNYSLQRIMKQNYKGNIIPYYQSIKPSVSNETSEPEHKYFLFVSGNRPVKNLIRTLEAFCLFKRNDNRGYYLYITSIDNQMLGNLCRYKKISKNIVDKWVRVYGFANDKELDDLYRNCSVFLYPSLYEGYGLPILEAAQYGKPSISSYTTSIPEVLGSCTFYIDPYNVDSISAGMEYMSQEHINRQYEKWLLECYPILERRMKIDLDIIFHNITNV